MWELFCSGQMVAGRVLKADSNDIKTTLDETSRGKKSEEDGVIPISPVPERCSRTLTRISSKFVPPYPLSQR